jgi:hypothetical protein
MALPALPFTTSPTTPNAVRVLPISTRLAAGEHPRATIVVRAPKPATTLRFSRFALTWEWPIPGAD